MNNMKKKLVLFASVAIALASCQTTPKEDYSWIKKGLDVASAQLHLTAEEIDGTGQLPRSIRTGYDMDFLCRQLERDPSTFQDSLRPQPTPEQMGKRRLCVVYDWTSGFFPGSLWYAYELTGNDTLKADAIQYTNLLNPVRYYKGTHDLGFMINCSYGNAERLAPNDTIKAVMKETADNLCGRFNDSIGTIRSWDFGSWNFPVIIDNMMNLEMLFRATQLTGDSIYWNVAVNHANTTLKNHFRPEFLNRLDETILFKPLTKDNIGGIIHLIIADLNRRLEDKQLTIRLSEEAMQYIVDNAYDPVYGARPLKRYIQKYVETLAAKMILADQVEEGDTIVITVENDQLAAKCEKGSKNQ